MLIALCNFEVLSEFSCFKHCIYDMKCISTEYNYAPYIIVISSVN